MHLRPFLLVVLCAIPFMGRAQAVCDSLHTILGSFFEHHGLMFSVVATEPVTIDHISANLFPGTRQYTLHKKTGGYVGYTDDPNAWTALDTVTVTSANTGFEQQHTAVIPIQLSINMLPGDTVSFFLTDQVVNGLFSFGNLTSAGNVVESDANIGITVAYSVPRNFGISNGTFEWSGRVAYCLAEELGVHTLTASGLSVIVSADVITISIPEHMISRNTPMIELRELSGRLVRSLSLLGSQVRISTEGLASAPYVIAILSKSGERSSQLVVVP